MKLRLISIIITCFFIFFSISMSDSSEQNYIRAKIGIKIKSGNSDYNAKARDMLIPGDLYRIYVTTEENSIIYIVHSDGKSVNLLNVTDQKIQSSTIILPSAQAYYQSDGMSSYERITIICSPHKLTEIQTLENHRMTPREWDLLLNRLKQESNPIESAIDDKPFSIAGNVRGVTDSQSDDSFFKTLQVYSGKGILIKNYEFKVKK